MDSENHEKNKEQLAKLLLKKNPTEQDVDYIDTLRSFIESFEDLQLNKRTL